MTDRELTNEMIKRADEFVEKQKREFAIVKLEKIKAEVDDIHNWCNPRMVKREFITLLNNHISELKGDKE